MGDELWCGQSQNGVNFDFQVKFDHESQGRLPLKTIGTLTKVFYTYGPNLVILAQTGDELSCGQSRDYCTHRCTDRQTQATTIPEGQNWPRVKMQPAAWYSAFCKTSKNLKQSQVLALSNRPVSAYYGKFQGTVENWLSMAV